MAWWNDVIDMNEGLRSMVGRTFVRVEGAVGAGEMVFVDQNGERFIFTHMQDCCETVDINDISGDLDDLVGEPLLVAEEVEGSVPADWDSGFSQCYTFTFYKFATRKGYVDVRWLGQSNGYYSERVDLCHEKP
ncbi:hypothetical protein EBZ38_06495 [bacterium]|nr:hypothetical protein [bacterium]NDD83910.1 hypothetical protein [bacterium]